MASLSHMSFSPSRTTANSQPSAKIITDALGVNIMAPLMYNNGGRLEEKSLRELVNPVMSSYGGAELLTSVLCDRIGDGEKDRKRRMKADSAMKKRYDADMARYEKANELPNVKRVSEWRLLRMGNNPGPKAMLRPKLGLEGVENMEGLGWDIWHSRVVQVELNDSIPQMSIEYSDMVKNCAVFPGPAKGCDQAAIDRRCRLRIDYLLEVARLARLESPAKMVVCFCDHLLSDMAEREYQDKFEKLDIRVVLRDEALADPKAVIRKVVKEEADRANSKRGTLAIPQIASNDLSAHWKQTKSNKRTDHELYYPIPHPPANINYRLTAAAIIFIFIDTSAAYYILHVIAALVNITGDYYVVIVPEVAVEIARQDPWVGQHVNQARTMIPNHWIDLPAENPIFAPYASFTSAAGEMRPLTGDVLITHQIAQAISTFAANHVGRSLSFPILTFDLGFPHGIWKFNLDAYRVIMPIISQQPTPPAYWLTTDQARQGPVPIRAEGLLPLFWHMLRDQWE